MHQKMLQVLSDGEAIGQRRAAQRVVALALKLLQSNEVQDAQGALLKALETLKSDELK